MSIYDNETKIYPDLNPSAPQESQTYRLQKWTEIEAFFLDDCQKNETIKYSHTYRGHSFNYISIDHWRNFYCSICQCCWPARWHYLRYSRLSFSSPYMHHMKSFQGIHPEAKRKHDAIKLLAQSKLESITDIISQANRMETSHPLNFTKYSRRCKNIASLRMTLETGPRPR